MRFILQLCSSWEDVSCHSASRGPSAIAELLVIPAKAREYVFTGVGLCVCVWCVCVRVCLHCLSVTIITKRLWTDLYQIVWEGF